MTKTLHRYLVVALFMGLFAVKAGAQYDATKIVSIKVSGFTGNRSDLFNVTYVPNGTVNGAPIFENSSTGATIVPDGNGNWNFTWNGDGLIYASSYGGVVGSQTLFEVTKWYDRDLGNYRIYPADFTGLPYFTFNFGQAAISSEFTYVLASSNSAFRDFGTTQNGLNLSAFGSSQAYEFTNGAWVAASGTMTPGKGYRVQMPAGGCSILANGSSLIVSDVDVTSQFNQTPDGYTFLSNPFATPIEFSNCISANNFQYFDFNTFNVVSVVQDGFWYLDPSVISPDGYQGYVFYGSLTGASNTYAGGLTLTNSIQPGQGFFIQTASTFTPSQLSNLTLGGIILQSGCQGGGASYDVFGAKALNRISTGLFTNGKNIDGAVAVFNSKFKSGYDINDGTKFTNKYENLTFLVGGKDLCANASSLPTATDVLAMHLYNLKANTTYTLKLNASEFVGNGLDAYLQDNVTNTKTVLSGANNEVTFTTGTDASAYATRYSIVFGASPLPVKNISLTAAKLGNSQVAVKWSTIGESNISSYKIERSSNGNSFTALATVSPSTAHSYSYIDASATAGTNYYRIKVVDVTGAVSYSKVVTINTSNSNISVYPNPVTGTNFKVSLGNSGKYNVSVVNMLGQKVFSTVINHTSGTLSSVAMTKQLAAGNYRLIAVDEDGTTNTTALTIK